MHNAIASTHSPDKPHAVGYATPVRELHAGHRAKILGHLLLLSGEDRRLRFGAQTSNGVIEHYVEHLNFSRDALFGSFDSQLRLIGMAHLAYLPKMRGQVKMAEFGVSVLPSGRRRGIGATLLARAAVHARNTNIETLFVHCLANNKAMMRLAQKAGMQVQHAHGDADASLKLQPANPCTIAEEAANKQWADFDYALKENFKRSYDAWSWFLGKSVSPT